MHVWRDIGRESSVGLYLVAWVIALLVTHLVSNIRTRGNRVPLLGYQVSLSSPKRAYKEVLHDTHPSALCVGCGRVFDEIPP